MPRITPGRKSITSIFLEEDYEKIKRLAAKSNKSMNEIVRDFTLAGLNGEVTESNIEFLAPIIREQMKVILEPYMERLISLTAKTCIQSGTAAYLSADAIYKFVPPAQREEVNDTYIEARKKAVSFLRNKIDVGEK